MFSEVTQVEMCTLDLLASLFFGSQCMICLTSSKLKEGRKAGRERVKKERRLMALG